MSQKYKPYAIICDIDGTLAHMNGRSPYDFSKLGTDTVDEAIRELVQMYADDDVDIILCTGRERKYRETTKRWLLKNAVPWTRLFMRPTGDLRQDTIIKQEILDKKITDHYRILFVLEDRDRVVKMFRNNGLKCLQVAEGYF